MNEWDERSEIQIIQLQSMIHTILKKYFFLVNQKDEKKQQDAIMKDWFAREQCLR